MGITKQYLRYVRGPTFGLVASNTAIVHLKLNGIDGQFVAVGACEDVYVWDLRKGEKVISLNGEISAVTCISQSPIGDYLAVGYADGCARVFNLNTSECEIVFNGHKSAVTSISYSDDGARLVTGSKDTEIVVWDVVNESGIVRLRGHKGPITRCRFMKKRNILVTSSRDTFVKFWDLDIQHCFYTLLGHKSEVWDFILLKNDSLLMTGSNDNELHVWKIEYKEEQNLTVKTFDVEHEDDEDIDNIISCTLTGKIPRDSPGRLVSLSTDKTERFIVTQGPGPRIEIFQVKSEEEIKQKLQKRLKKERKKAKQNPDTTETTTDVPDITIADEIPKIGSIKAHGKVKGNDIIIQNDGQIKAFLLLHNNSIETYTLNAQTRFSDAIESAKLYLPGHRSDIRAVSFSSDNIAVLSGSAESVKIWNTSSQKCVRTMDCNFAISLSFTPGDRHCIVGTKDGKLKLFDIASATLLKSIDAHQGTIWSLCLSPDQKTFVTGSADKEVKFWDFDINDDAMMDHSGSSLTFEHTRTLQLSEDVLCVKLSQDDRLLAAALLDSTIKVFFVDTFKFFLSLYGHKLPVLCLDISTDGTLLISGSADRNIKIWGLDFGDCHRSLFAHADSVMCIQFIPNTHMFFSGGKDGLVNQWDADTFNKITTLKGHHGDVWALAVSPNGKHVVSSSKDKSIRLWDRTQEPLVLEEEQEMEREEEYEKQLETGDNAVVIPGETNTEAVLPGRKTTETIKAIEKLMESLDIYDEEVEKVREHEAMCKAQNKKLPPPQAHPLVLALNASSPDHFFTETLKRIKSSELEEALLVLPYGYLPRILKVLSTLLDKDWEVELVCRCLFFLLRIHHGHITSNATLLTVIEKLRDLTMEKISDVKDMVSFNLAGLTFVKQDIEAQEQVFLFEDASKQFAEKRKRKQKQELAKRRAILTLY